MEKRQYDLEDRTFQFACAVVAVSKQLPKDVANVQLIKQLVRAAGSVGANYIEANEALSNKDFAYRIKICKKEAKESRYWLRLIRSFESQEQEKLDELVRESTELLKIFSSILRTLKGRRASDLPTDEH